MAAFDNLTEAKTNEIIKKIKKIGINYKNNSIEIQKFLKIINDEFEKLELNTKVAENENNRH